MTIFVPLYFEVVHHLTASQSGIALIPLMGATVLSSTLTGKAMGRITHYKRMPLIGLPVGILALGALAIWPAAMPMPLVLLLLTIVGAAFGSVFPISTVCMQNAVSRAHVGVATATANFFRSLVSALVVAVLGAIVLGGLGGGTGEAVEMLARVAPGDALAIAFRFVFLTCALVLAFSLAFIVAMEEQALKGPPTPTAATTPQAPATPIPTTA
jgi:MFS family permease